MPFLPARIQDMHRALRDGRAGYRLAQTFRTTPLPLPGLHPDLGDTPRRGREFSDLSTINPTMEVFERVGAEASAGGFERVSCEGFRPAARTPHAASR